MFGRKNPTIKIIKHLDTSSLPWCNEAVLISVTNGMGVLAVHRKNVPDSDYGSVSFTVLELNHIPLVQARLPGCPTCAGMIATGFGIENTNNAELKEISEKLNSDYINITTSVETLKPLLFLLPTGLYVIADAIMYPTDGNGHFFWDVPNQFSENPSTAAVLTEKYDYITGFPSFLYPSQSNECFNEQRINYYKERFSKSENWPRAISYHLGEFISILLDGHHKVAAAALLGKETRCIDIIPMSSMRYNGMKTVEAVYFTDIEIPANDIPSSIRKIIKQTFGKNTGEDNAKYKPTNLITKTWAQDYTDSVKYYPELSELAESIAVGIDNITDELIAECLSGQSDENLRKLRFIILKLSRKGDGRLKGLALRCARLNADLKLVEVSFKALVKMKGDIDIEKFFVDYLIDHYDKHDILKRIADSYWN